MTRLTRPIGCPSPQELDTRGAVMLPEPGYDPTDEGYRFFEKPRWSDAWDLKPSEGSPVDAVSISMRALEREIRALAAFPQTAHTPQLHIVRGDTVSHVETQEPRDTLLGEARLSLEAQLELFQGQWGAPADSFPGNAASYPGGPEEFSRGYIHEVGGAGYFEDGRKTLIIPVGMLCATALQRVRPVRKTSEENGRYVVRFEDEPPFVGSDFARFIGRDALKHCGGGAGLAVAARTDLFRIVPTSRSTHRYPTKQSRVFAPIVATVPVADAYIRDGQPYGPTEEYIRAARERIGVLNDDLYDAYC